MVSVERTSWLVVLAVEDTGANPAEVRAREVRDYLSLAGEADVVDDLPPSDRATQG